MFSDFLDFWGDFCTVYWFIDETVLGGKLQGYNLFGLIIQKMFVPSTDSSKTGNVLMT
jgi:hypothetical protein